MRSTWTAFLISLIVFVAIATHAGATSCAGPELSIGGPGTTEERSRLTAGEDRSVVGRNWLKGDCSSSAGCWAGAPSPEPYEEVEVRVTGPVTPEMEAALEKSGEVEPGPISMPAGLGDPLDNGSFAIHFVVPDLPTGASWIVATDARPIPVSIEGR